MMQQRDASSMVASQSASPIQNPCVIAEIPEGQHNKEFLQIHTWVDVQLSRIQKPLIGAMLWYYGSMLIVLRNTALGFRLS